VQKKKFKKALHPLMDNARILPQEYKHRHCGWLIFFVSKQTNFIYLSQSGNATLNCSGKCKKNNKFKSSSPFSGQRADFAAKLQT
jgi:hypothetical protein